jgi:hypothetical protein
MKRGRHAANDGSFARSASVNAGRGAFLIVIAVAVGFLLLHDADKGGGGSDTIVNTPQQTTPSIASSLPTLPSSTTLAVHANKDVKILVVNATRTAGAASRVAKPFKDTGYNVLRPVDATEAVKNATKASAVYYVTADYQRDAKAIQQALGLPPGPVQVVPTPPPTTDLLGANVIIVVGPDLAGAGTTSTTRAGATTSTVRRTTTTT